jgi:hypothetical protein
MWAEPTFDEVHSLLGKYPGLVTSFGMQEAMKFIRLTASLKLEILHYQKATKSEHDIPSELPGHVSSFLSSAMGFPDEFVNGCWSAFKETIWSFEEHAHEKAADAKTFYEHGTRLNLCEYVSFSLMSNINNFVSCSRAVSTCPTLHKSTLFKRRQALTSEGLSPTHHLLFTCRWCLHGIGYPSPLLRYVLHHLPMQCEDC